MDETRSNMEFFDLVRSYFRQKPLPRHKHSVWYYFGGFSVFFLVLQIISGLLLSFYYEPSARIDSERKKTDSVQIEQELSPSIAYSSVERIEREIPSGALVRSLHRYSADGFIACVLVHLLSAFWMRSYRRPRAFLWISGIFLLIIMLAFAFTGSILPWNILSFNAAEVGLSSVEYFVPGVGNFLADLLRGGEMVCEETLTRMYALHVIILPLALVLLAILHLAMTYKIGLSTPKNVKIQGGLKFAGILSGISVAVWLGFVLSQKIRTDSSLFFMPIVFIPVLLGYILGEIAGKMRLNPDGTSKPLFYSPNVAYRGIIIWSVGLLMMVAIATLVPFQTPHDLNLPADLSKPMPTPSNIHPAWYFMPVFLLLKVLSGGIAVSLIVLVLIFFLAVPFLDNSEEFTRKSIVIRIVGFVIVGILFLASI